MANVYWILLFLLGPLDFLHISSQLTVDDMKLSSELLNINSGIGGIFQIMGSNQDY